METTAERTQNREQPVDQVTHTILAASTTSTAAALTEESHQEQLPPRSSDFSVSHARTDPVTGQGSAAVGNSPSRRHRILLAIRTGQRTAAQIPFSSSQKLISVGAQAPPLTPVFQGSQGSNQIQAIKRTAAAAQIYKRSPPGTKRKNDNKKQFIQPDLHSQETKLWINSKPR